MRAVSLEQGYAAFLYHQCDVARLKLGFELRPAVGVRGHPGVPPIGASASNARWQAIVPPHHAGRGIFISMRERPEWTSVATYFAAMNA